MDKKKLKSHKWTLVDPSTSDLAMAMSSRESVTSQVSGSSMVPHEESVLEMYFSLLSHTSFDKAKDLVDTEKDGHKFSVMPHWGELLQCLSQLAASERSYANLVYLGHKRVMHIVRTKDSTKSLYSLLMQEFLRMDNAPGMRPLTPGTRPLTSSLTSDPGVGETETLLADICGQLHKFICARLKMMDFYEQLATLGSTRHWLNFDDLLMMCEEVLKEVKGFHHPLLSPLEQTFCLEVSSLCHLLQAQIDMCQWSYLPSVLQLQQAHTKLHTWAQNIPMKESKSTFRSSSKPCPFPPLLNWLIKFKGVLLSKFGLYFHEILSKQTVASELKMNQWKVAEDFYGRIQAFHKKQDSCCVYLILDTHDLHPRVGEGGYLYPGKYAPPPQGVRTYPPIFSYPLGRVMSPSQWPDICMLISSQTETKYLYQKGGEKRPQSSYFLSRLDSRVWLALVFETKRSEKDSGINAFLSEMTSLLRCQAVISSLKSFAKS